MAFCAWLSDRLGYAVRLPAEWEWQQAACSGNPQFDYPWGAEYCSGCANIDETEDKAGQDYLQRTTAVGLYPQGNSLQGASDLSGNVWEWCLNEYGKPSNIQPDGTEPRVVRGGSWTFNQDYARASFRYSSYPEFRYDRIGFRVCCLSPILTTEAPNR
jgi:formylglycine-generating enzyme required for sulfatase activity